MKSKSLPDVVKVALANSVFIRRDKTVVGIALKKLGVEVSDSFRKFFETYQGPLGSSNTGFELSDICERSYSILKLTEICRDVHGFPKRFLVISDLVGNAAIVYDSKSDHVYTIDFEGTDQELIQGKLEPDWESFYDFLDFFFNF